MAALEPVSSFPLIQNGFRQVAEKKLWGLCVGFVVVGLVFFK